MNSVMAISTIQKILNAIFAVLIAIFKTMTIDMYKNIRDYAKMALYKEERMKMRQKIETEKRLELVEDRLDVAERLLYSIFEQPDYTKTKEGESDLKQLSKHARRAKE